ncbi:MAG: ribosomal protein [Firmicutes bacterium]|nr:ribosomal protein [Bacillota bacterium]
MKNYEIMFIVKPLEEEATNAVITKFETLITANGGTVEKIDRWGKRRLAYEVKDFIDGFYCLMHFASEPNVIAELDRVMKITEDVIKHMIIRKEE